MSLKGDRLGTRRHRRIVLSALPRTVSRFQAAIIWRSWRSTALPRRLENSSLTTVDLIGLKIAQSGIEDRHGDAAPRCTLYQVPNRVLTLCGPTILHVDQQGWSIS